MTQTTQKIEKNLQDFLEAYKTSGATRTSFIEFFENEIKLLDDLSKETCSLVTKFDLLTSFVTALDIPSNTIGQLNDSHSRIVYFQNQDNQKTIVCPGNEDLIYVKEDGKSFVVPIQSKVYCVLSEKLEKNSKIVSVLHGNSFLTKVERRSNDFIRSCIYTMFQENHNVQVPEDITDFDEKYKYSLNSVNSAYGLIIPPINHSTKEVRTMEDYNNLKKEIDETLDAINQTEYSRVYNSPDNI